MKRFVVFLNGDYGSDDPDYYRRLSAGAVVIAADGAIEVLERFGIAADVLVGDFDSAKGSQSDYSGIAEVISHDSDKDATDGELALALALERGADELALCGYRGDQSDHELGNLLLLELAHRISTDIPAERIYAASETERVWFVKNETIKVVGKIGEFVSLVSLDSEITVSQRGFRYESAGQRFLRGSTRPLRNELAEEEAEISVSGAALVIQQFGVSG